MHRTEFEAVSAVEKIRRGKTMRISTSSSVLAGFVQKVDEFRIRLFITSGYKEGELEVIFKEDVTDVVEICSSNTFHKLSNIVSGEQKSGGLPNII